MRHFGQSTTPHSQTTLLAFPETLKVSLWHLAIMGQIPPSSLIAWHSNGRGTWVRDLEIIALPHLFCHWRHDHTVAAILQR